MGICERASELDQAYGSDPWNLEVVSERTAALDELAAEELGLVFRYIPSGPFEMGSEEGDPDERPVHTVELDDFWMSDTPLSWARYCDLMDLEPPPSGLPRVREKRLPSVNPIFYLSEENKLRLQYCETRTVRGLDWHWHAAVAQRGEALSYDTKPAVSVSWQEVELLCGRHSTDKVRYRLPTEAQWEKAARGGLRGRRYAWGDEPAAGRCDCDRFGSFAIAPMRQYPPNGYGLYAMCGGVWEWTSDWYDAMYYAESPRSNPAGAANGEIKAARGGSWADSPDVVTVSFRTGFESRSWRDNQWSAPMVPNCGFRLCRMQV